MFVKREDGLRFAFLPYELFGLIAAALLTASGGVRGWLCVPVFIGWWLCGTVGSLAFVIFLIFLMSLTVDMNKPVPEDDHPFYRAVVVYVIGLLCRVGRVRIRTEGLEKLPDGRFLIVSNHLSAYDPIVTVWALRRRPTAFITKPENHKIIIAGPMIYKANYLPIDRSDPRSAMTTINAAANLLKNDVVSVGVYPEGTRGDGGEMLPFHNGVFKIAQKARAPLVVAAITGTERITENLPWRHTDVTLRVSEVIPAEELGGSTADIGGRVREIIGRELAEMSKQ